MCAGANALDAVHESWRVQGFNWYLPRRKLYKLSPSEDTRAE